ncbi:MAG: TerB family tellurite resistance protein [Pseudomonadales bacterium]|nr:TerB family tellurite resistance protein [Pseudomonadales bacterium]MBO6566942.1 TerB family tellurite resistance protein [Pseudomonadales bacterium]MBO6597711.1 TerB family tellurite resistance protein [Pseudomonadales bacterium]MBO6657901.1 TerB family tellurite resistance protein [Pseudomonadales bacterium]MBO6704026.1 TerB family tellurite resistance protein [Pseudomonadales bacterium]
MFLYELNRAQKEAFICLCHDVVVSDGDLTPDEQQMMDTLRREIGLDENFEPHYIPVDGINEIFDTRRSRVAVVINLIRLGYADGAFEVEEQMLVKQVYKLFELTENDFRLIENWVRRLVALEKEALALM